jgi:hypothetical protein
MNNVVTVYALLQQGRRIERERRQQSGRAGRRAR